MVEVMNKVEDIMNACFEKREWKVAVVSTNFVAASRCLSMSHDGSAEEMVLKHIL